AIDMDGDGDVDLVNKTSMEWYENTHDPLQFGRQHVLTGYQFDPASTRAVADLDDDGDVDMISAVFRSSALDWLNLFPEPKQVNEIIVDTIQDSLIENDGKISLREAIRAAEASTSDDRISFDKSLNGGTIRLVLGELVVNPLGDLQIVGPGAGALTIDASANDRTPQIKQGDGSRVVAVRSDKDTHVVISGVSITGADVPFGTFDDGGAVFNRGWLSLHNVVIKGNHADGDGGGIYNSGIIEVDRVTVRDNSTGRNGGGIANSNVARISNSWISGNSAQLNGGGVYTQVDLQLERTTVSDNHTVGFYGSDGAGVAIRAGVALLTDSTVARNVVDFSGQGAGLHGRAAILTLRNSTVADNVNNDPQAYTGILLEGGNLYLENSVVAADRRLGNPLVAADLIDLRHTIVMTNRGSTLVPTGRVADAYGNFVGSDTSPLDTGLGEFGARDGNPPAYSLLADSLAIDAGDNAFTRFTDTDQHGVPRIVGSHVDIGAYEFVAKGNVNYDETIDARDIDRLCAAVLDGENSYEFDLNRDGTVNHTDVATLVKDVLHSVVGDANLDGIFNSRDLVAIFQYGLYEDSLERNAGWSAGDWNCDGDFTSSDLVVAFQSGKYQPF
ncbi:MAG: hypothetical protein KDB23_01085, partial [Planctomycetales bacterium]|nr:hypothetical protein [Planctomycetales bacterium]